MYSKDQMSANGKKGYLKAKDKDKLLALSQALTKKNKEKVKGKVCPECSKPMAYEKRMYTFCSHSCAAKNANKKGLKT